MSRKISNLEEYYLELQKGATKYRRVLFTPFNELPQWEIDELECSEGYRKFLIRGAWTKGLMIVCLVLIPILVVLGAIYLDSHR